MRVQREPSARSLPRRVDDHPPAGKGLAGALAIGLAGGAMVVRTDSRDSPKSALHEAEMEIRQLCGTPPD